MTILVGITGASGTIYGYRLLQYLHEMGIPAAAIVTAAGKQVLAYECGVSYQDLAQFTTLYENDDLFAPPASGSYLCQGMIIAPCSMNTLGMTAAGICPNLLTRAAAVTLKEQRKLILVPRETPLSVIQLENMHKLALAGAIILPAAPGFYSHPATLEELVDSVISRMLDQLGILNTLGKRWNGKTPAAPNSNV